MSDRSGEPRHIAFETYADLRTSERRFRALADSMPQLVWTAAADGTVDYYNARAHLYDGIVQFPDGTWRWQAVVHPEDLDATQARWNAAAETGADYSCEHRIRMRDGSYRWHVSRASRVDEHGQLRWYGTATDIHELKLAQEQLQGAVAARDKVVSIVAHDLRNPLAVVRTAVSLLHGVVESHGDPERARRGEGYLTRVDRQVSKMEKLLDELLDGATLQAGRRLELERRPCDLVAIVRELVDELATGGLAQPIEVHASPPTLVGAWDAARIERVVGNLLSNALKYSPRGRGVTVSVEEDGSDAIVRVLDRGVGIAPADQQRIFEWFARGENAGTTARGIGIGLAGARRIVEQHGGSLTVESQLGVGSAFEVRLPRQVEDGA